MRCRRAAKSAQRRMATKGRPGRSAVGDPASALQTHLQGVDWAALAVMIVMENSHSRGPPFSVERRQITVASEAEQAVGRRPCRMIAIIAILLARFSHKLSALPLATGRGPE